MDKTKLIMRALIMLPYWISIIFVGFIVAIVEESCQID